MFTIPSNHTWSHHARVEVLPQTSPTDICDIPGFPLISLNTCYICVSQSWDISGFLLISLFAMSGLSSPLSYRYRGHHGTFPDVPQHYVCVPGPLSLTDTGDISGLSADVFQHLLCMCPRSNLVPQIEGTSRDFLLMSLNTSLLCSYVSHAGPTSPTDTGDISGLSLMSLTLPCYVCVPGPTRPTDTGDISRLSPDVPNTYLLCMLLTSTGTRITQDFPLILLCYVCVPDPTCPADTGDISGLSPDVPNTSVFAMYVAKVHWYRDNSGLSLDVPQYFFTTCSTDTGDISGFPLMSPQYFFAMCVSQVQPALQIQGTSRDFP